MLTWIIVLIVIVIVLLFLCVPFDIQISFFTQKRPAFRIDLEWAFKLFSFRLYPRVKKKSSGYHTTSYGRSPVRSEERRRTSGWQVFMDILLIRGILPWVLKSMRGLWRSLHFKKITGTVMFSVEEPQTYAYLFVFCWYVNHLFAQRGHDFILDPLFEGQYEFDSMSTVVVRVFPVIVLVNLAGCIFSPVFFRLISILARSA